MKKLFTAALIALTAAVLIAVTGCGGGGSSASPKEVAEQYMRASVNLDVDAAYDLLSEADRQNLTKEQMEEEAAMMESLDFDYQIGEETVSGDTATVEVTLVVTDKESGETQEITEELNLVKENGAWKISFGDSL